MRLSLEERVDLPRCTTILRCRRIALALIVVVGLAQVAPAATAPVFFEAPDSLIVPYKRYGTASLKLTLKGKTDGLRVVVPGPTATRSGRIAPANNIVADVKTVDDVATLEIRSGHMDIQPGRLVEVELQLYGLQNGKEVPDEPDRLALMVQGPLALNGPGKTLLTIDGGSSKTEDISLVDPWSSGALDTVKVTAYGLFPKHEDQFRDLADIGTLKVEAPGVVAEDGREVCYKLTVGPISRSGRFIINLVADSERMAQPLVLPIEVVTRADKRWALLVIAAGVFPPWLLRFLFQTMPQARNRSAAKQIREKLVGDVKKEVVAAALVRLTQAEALNEIRGRVRDEMDALAESAEVSSSADRKRSVWLQETGLGFFTAFVAVLSGYWFIYLGEKLEPFGSERDYVGAFLWGSGVDTASRSLGTIVESMKRLLPAAKVSPLS